MYMDFGEQHRGDLKRRETVIQRGIFGAEAKGLLWESIGCRQGHVLPLQAQLGSAWTDILDADERLRNLETRS